MSSLRLTCFPVESVRVKSGAFWPTCGAPVEAGSQRAAMKTTKTKKEKTTRLRALTIAVTIFDLVGCERSEENPRLIPMTISAKAIKKISKLAHGKSRVTGNQTNTEK